MVSMAACRASPSSSHQAQWVSAQVSQAPRLGTYRRCPGVAVDEEVCVAGVGVRVGLAGGGLEFPDHGEVPFGAGRVGDEPAKVGGLVSRLVRFAVAGAAQGLGGCRVVPAVLEQGVGPELGVGLLGLEDGGGGEDVEAVGVVALAGGGGDAGVGLLGATPGEARAEASGLRPAVRGEDVVPGGAVVVVVPWPLSGACVADGGGRCRVGVDGHLVEEVGDGVEHVALFGGDGRDGGGAAGVLSPGLAGGVDTTAGGRDDGVAAFAAGLDEDFDGLVSAGAAGELGVAADGAVDAVPHVVAAGWGLGEAAAHEGVEDAFDAVVPAGFAEALPVGGGDGAAFELEHLEVAGDGAADDADAVVCSGRSGATSRWARTVWAAFHEPAGRLLPSAWMGMTEHPASTQARTSASGMPISAPPGGSRRCRVGLPRRTGGGYGKLIPLLAPSDGLRGCGWGDGVSVPAEAPSVFCCACEPRSYRR
jgi:hypothetical protein